MNTEFGIEHGEQQHGKIFGEFDSRDTPDTNSDTTTSSDSCATCRKKIWMQGHINLALCTVMLDLVSLDQAGCEDYAEHTGQTGNLFAKGM